jgi:O-antigen/teichoic acid export membrane protein
LLSILAAGYYADAALGFNGAILRVHGKARIIVLANLLTAAAAVVLSFVLIDRFGAVGAAMATTATLLLQNAFNFVGLALGRTDVRLLAWQHMRVYLLIAVVFVSLLAAELSLDPPVYVTALVASLAALAIIRISRHSVDPRAAFPELLRIPAVRWLLA